MSDTWITNSVIWFLQSKRHGILEPNTSVGIKTHIILITISILNRNAVDMFLRNSRILAGVFISVAILKDLWFNFFETRALFTEDHRAIETNKCEKWTHDFFFCGKRGLGKWMGS